MNRADPSIVVLGQFVTVAVMDTRRLPSSNFAASNRMLRLAQAAGAANFKPWICAPGSSLRMPWTGRLWHPQLREKQGGVTVLTAPAIGLPLLSAVAELLILPMLVLHLCLRQKPAAILLYNYYPSNVVAAWLCRLFTSTKVLLDIEDVCTVQRADFTGGGDQRPWLQVVGSVGMRAAIWAAHHVIVPCRRFERHLPAWRPVSVIGGCLDQVPPLTARSDAEPALHLLISGTLDRDQGVDVALEAVSLAARDPTLSSLVVDLCGVAPNPAWLDQQIANVRASTVTIRYRGQVDRPTYEHLLQGADLCLALQDPHGRHGQYKTPSKVIEYLAHGKAVIATDVGDLADLPSEVITISAMTAAEAASHVSLLLHDRSLRETMGKSARAYAAQHWAFAVVGARMCRIIGNAHRARRS